MVTPPGDIEGELDYARQIGVSARSVTPIEPADVGVRIVPTVVVVNKTGRIRFVREGALAPGDKLAISDLLCASQ